MAKDDTEEARKEEIFDKLAKKFKSLAGTDLTYGEGMITAYTLEDENGKEVVELQTDFGDHLDLLVILDGKNFSLGGDYIHGINAWEEFSRKASDCLEKIFKERKASEDAWYKGEHRIGGRLYIPEEGPDSFKLIDREGKKVAFLASSKRIDHVFRFKQANVSQPT